MYIIKKDEMKVPLKIWSSEDSIESQCLEQMEKVSSLPFLHKHVALMPDAHLGVGASIGSVVATKGVVIPSLVGSDIGCGLCAVQTSLKELDTDTLKKIMGEIRKVIPVGFNKHKKAQDEGLMPEIKNTTFNGKDNIYSSWLNGMKIVCKEYDNALKSLGTLGGGNHFIEIQKGSDGHIWIMIHSGSRNLGKQVADHYSKLAAELNEKWYSSVPKKHELAFLPLDSDEGKTYISEMNYCVEFALANRKLMMERIQYIFADFFDGKTGEGERVSGVAFDEIINIAHNYASMENHFGENLLVHRKGATKAAEGLIGIIPGSQGTKSYIVEGLGNKESFMSCSHGAGRRMGRGQAIRELDLEKEKEALDSKGIIHSVRNAKDLQEAPSAYKDIDEVMENQKDLVKIKVELTPLGVIKG
jgi:tRNA-splicing ligase RtcB